tara:strand:- start:208 stop:384 length:177 start_codon:yes stop_codon:yes gene_type:complete
MNKNYSIAKSNMNQRLVEEKLFDHKQGIANSLMAKYMPSKEFKVIDGGKEANKEINIG